jgi:hypothetical protein
VDGITRLGVAIVVAAVLGFVLVNVRRVPRDLALTGYALVVAVLGIFAILGLQAAAIGGAIVVFIFVIGAAIYGLLALFGHFADNAREKND